MDVELADLAPGDAGALAALMARNRADIERTEPARADSFYTVDGQRDRIMALLGATRAGSMRCWTIRIGGRIRGEIAVTGIERGPFLNGHVGYLVDRAERGRGVATCAVRLVAAHAFGEMRLHRLDAGVMTWNLASQRVLAKAGFTLVGLAPSYLFLDGAWRDHHLYQLVSSDSPPPLGGLPAG